MSIIKRRSHGSPDKKSPSISSAYEMQKRSRFAKGGRVYSKDEHNDSPTGPTNYTNRNKSSDMDHGSRKGPEGYSKYQEQAQNQKGVHTPVSGVTGSPGGKGTSEAGDMSTQTWKGEPHRELRDHGKELHRKKLEEIKAMPKPKLAQGGMVKISGPRMAESSIIKPRMRDELTAEEMRQHEEHLMRSEMPQDETEHIQYDDENAEHSDMFAEGGEVEMQEEQPMDEEEMEHHDSIAAAIMSRRAKYAEGGMVGIESNEQEEPNQMDEMNEAALKENYDEDFTDLTEPMDSNEHSDNIPSDKFDRIREIRSKYKRMR